MASPNRRRRSWVLAASLIARAGLIASVLAVLVVIQSGRCKRHAEALTRIKDERVGIARRVQANRCDDEIFEEAFDQARGLVGDRRRLLENAPLGFDAWLTILGDESVKDS